MARLLEDADDVVPSRLGDFGRPVAGEKNRREGTAVTHERFVELDAAHARKPHIQYHATRPRQLRRVEELLSRCKTRNRELLDVEEEPQRFAHRGIVLHHDDGRSIMRARPHFRQLLAP